MAECHPVAFQWVMEAKARGATLIHVDPRSSRAVSRRHLGPSRDHLAAGPGNSDNNHASEAHYYPPASQKLLPTCMRQDLNQPSPRQPQPTAYPRVPRHRVPRPVPRRS